LTEMLDRLYLPDAHHLNTMIWGMAGSGKSVFIDHTLRGFLKQNKDKELRVVIIAPKNEDYVWGNIVHTLQQLELSIRMNRVSVLYPAMENIEGTVDEAIDMMFNFQAKNPKSSFVFILDDSQVFLSSRRDGSDAHKRLALTGRSRKIKGVYVAHNITFNRSLEGQIDLLVGFSSVNPIYYRASIERFGYDPEPFAPDLMSLPYSFVWFDTRNKEPQLMKPLVLSS
jgi:hypothetical protein